MEHQTIRLHPAQKAFLDSQAKFRAFVGGVGSGKSWAGAYDLLKRAKPDRLYMVCAPTYGMLQDATFRSFCELAQELGVVDPQDIKRGAPPSILLRTGAEILFRSADNPDSLRGPNLSGVWLDEASLMPMEAFTVCIGRLRQGGEVGFLTSTFTPKGRGHWTFEVFGSNRTDTALFHCRTADNPFLPADFYETVRRQYSSIMASQELEGLFVDRSGTMFQRDWFTIVDIVPTMTSTVRAWDLAATPKDEKKARDPDYTAGVLLGRDAAGTIYVLDVRRKRGTPSEIQTLIKHVAEVDGPSTAIHQEQEPGSSGKTVVDFFVRLLAGFNFHGERSTGSKADRAQPMAAMAEAGAIKVLKGPWNKDFLDELEIFPLGGHDDQVDAASLAFSKIASVVDWTFEPREPDSLISRMPRDLREPFRLDDDDRRDRDAIGEITSGDDGLLDQMRRAGL